MRESLTNVEFDEKNTAAIKHGFFERVVRVDNGGFCVELSGQLPVKSFRLVAPSTDSTGYNDLQSDLIFVDPDGDHHRIFGYGESIEASIEDALVCFVNLVVHHEELDECSFVIDGERAAV